MKYENTFKAIDQILWKEQELERREAELLAREKELARLIKMGSDKE